MFVTMNELTVSKECDINHVIYSDRLSDDKNIMNIQKAIAIHMGVELSDHDVRSFVQQRIKTKEYFIRDLRKLINQC